MKTKGSGYIFNWENGFVKDYVGDNFLLTERKVEEILLAEENNIYTAGKIDSVIVMDLAVDYGFQNLGDYGDGCLFLLNPENCDNDLLKYVQ